MNLSFPLDINFMIHKFTTKVDIKKLLRGTVKDDHSKVLINIDISLLSI